MNLSLGCIPYNTSVNFFAQNAFGARVASFFHPPILLLCTGCVLRAWYFHHPAAVCVILKFAFVKNNEFEPRMRSVQYVC